MNLKFRALDYTSEDSFVPADYEYIGDEATGWEIRRDGKTYMNLGPGYIPLETKSCGVCSTDIDRRFLPFPLPQIIGHEVLAEGLGDKRGRRYVVEINDTLEARGDKNLDEFCKAGIPTHSPERKVLGIDRLPGGFGPYILAPVHAAIEVTELSSKAAVLMEPFAAALQAILASPPKENDSVAVLGPRRLGSLILAALASYRKSKNSNFRITAITRHDHLVKLAKKMGADEVVDLRSTSAESLSETFDIVYDTTSTSSGFISALQFAKRELHLKTTNGQEMSGISHLTELVVDELSILPFSETNLEFKWKTEQKTNQSVFFFPSVFNLESKMNGTKKTFKGTALDGEKILASDEFQSTLPRFDIVVVGSPKELAEAIRPNPTHENSLVRPRGAILVDTSHSELWNDENKKVLEFFQKGKEIHTSRCGDFHFAIQLLKDNPGITQALEENLISHRFPSDQLLEAYAKAKDPSSVKVVVDFSPVI
ncbi:alcohol dehydrogenase catalytic domain-containing protein [Leptospira sp. 96542]|nr:alcohol dehydrogenase catalytic domain-containing protein [Leptospira sp. 96542]